MAQHLATDNVSRSNNKIGLVGGTYCARALPSKDPEDNCVDRKSGPCLMIKVCSTVIFYLIDYDERKSKKSGISRDVIHAKNFIIGRWLHSNQSLQL